MILTSLLPRAPYPSPSHVAVDATRQSAQNADYQHLQELDLLWTGAILSDRAQKDCQNRPLRDRDFLLDSTIKVGLYDNEAATLGTEGVLPSRQIESFLRVFKQFTHNLPSRQVVSHLSICPPL